MTAYTRLQERRAKSIPQGAYSVTPGYIKKAQGAMMIDVDGRELIDFAGGIGVNNVGHAHPKVVAAIQDQAGQFIHTCWHVGMYEAYIELAEKLNELAPGDFAKMTMFANSGAEAVENAVKTARYATNRAAVVCFENAFHGRTLLGMSLTSKIKPYKYNFGPFAPEVYRAPFAYCYRCPFRLEYPGCDLACADHLEEFFINQVDPEDTAAVLAEPIQGEGGFITPPPGYFQRLQSICRKYDIPLIIDEVQSGAGRTGTFLAIEHWEGVEPDLITMAKSLAGGMPLSAITGRAEIMNTPHMGGLGGTYSGNPVSCRAALAVLDVLLKDRLIRRGAEIGSTIRTRLEEMHAKYEIIGDVRGLGAMQAIELVQDRESKAPAGEAAKKLTQSCFDRGLVLLSCGNYGNVIRTLMPFVITDEQLERGLQILEEGIKELSG
jgi:4-aminobutyrate aminotransferase/(S)-3-amino-2-methylpropionate transaminase